MGDDWGFIVQSMGMRGPQSPPECSGRKLLLGVRVRGSSPGQVNVSGG